MSPRLFKRWLLKLLSWYPLVMFRPLQLIWRSGTRRCHRRVPDLQMSCSDLTLRELLCVAKRTPVLWIKLVFVKHFKNTAWGQPARRGYEGSREALLKSEYNVQNTDYSEHVDTGSPQQFTRVVVPVMTTRALYTTAFPSRPFSSRAQANNGSFSRRSLMSPHFHQRKSRLCQHWGFPQ